MVHRSFLAPVVWLAAFATTAAAISTTDISTTEAKRLSSSAAVVTSLRDQPDKGIPEKLWQGAACVVVIPDLKKAALGVGGEYGKGVMSCRTGNRWSAPAFMQLAKGSWGLQIGGAEVDLVLLVMNRDGAAKLLKDKVSLGAGASIAAGPVGRAAAAATDAKLSAEILSYSRTRGIFAGIDISGGVLGPDKDANTDVYGANADPQQIPFGNVTAPKEAEPFLTALSSQTVGTSGR